MAYIPKIKINGVETAAPLPLERSVNAIDKDSGRTANGVMVRYFVGDKITLAFEWKFITVAEGRQILNLVKGSSCNITYDDSELGVVTKKFYVSSRSSKMSTTEGFFEYIKFNAIEF